jgi:hypothetical protein
LRCTAVLTPNADAREVSGGSFLNLENRAITNPVLGIPVDEKIPGKIREMPARTSCYEPNGYDPRHLIALALVAVAALMQLELIGRAGKAIAVLTDKPLRKLERAYASCRRWVSQVTFRRFSKVVRWGEIEIGIQRAKPREQRAT